MKFRKQEELVEEPKFQIKLSVFKSAHFVEYITSVEWASPWQPAIGDNIVVHYGENEVCLATVHHFTNDVMSGGYIYTGIVCVLNTDSALNTKYNNNNEGEK